MDPEPWESTAGSEQLNALHAKFVASVQAAPIDSNTLLAVAAVLNGALSFVTAVITQGRVIVSDEASPLRPIRVANLGFDAILRAYSVGLAIMLCAVRQRYSVRTTTAAALGMSFQEFVQRLFHTIEPELQARTYLFRIVDPYFSEMITEMQQTVVPGDIRVVFLVGAAQVCECTGARSDYPNGAFAQTMLGMLLGDVVLNSLRTFPA